VAAADSGSGPNEELLSRLTDSTEPPQPVPKADEKEKVETQPVDSHPFEQEQSKASILDKLTGRSRPTDEGEQETDKLQAGESGDA
jgi:hypothetical protein